jgi:hypothetical protein
MGDAPRKASASRLVKTKKRLASLVASSKAGRSTIVRFIGESGELTVQSLKSAAETVYDKKTSKDLKEQLVALVMKCGVLVESNIVSIDVGLPLRV